MSESAEEYVQSGKALRSQGQTLEAIGRLETAVALAPHYAEAHMILGGICADAGDWEKAAVHCSKAVSIVPDSSDVRRHFAHCLSQARFRWIPEGVPEALQTCFRDPRVDSQELAVPAISILSLAPEPLDHPLFPYVMTRTVVCDADWELMLTRIRREILLDDAHASAAIWIAVQCLNNEHIWAVTPEEEAAPKRDAIRFCLYAPISQLPAGLRKDLPGPLHERLLEWIEESEIRASFTGAALNDETTARVKGQYEENPFPRWFSTSAEPAMSVAELLRLQLPEFSPPEFCEDAPKILIAGCGTGREAVDMALRHPSARITAIDITTASLSYAVRMARRYGVSNLRFEQLSLLDVARLGETFDVVECSGVLHHIPDPLAGWTALLDVLRPGGLMYVGLYSELAWAHIVSARERIARPGMSMREFRQQIIRERENAASGELLTWSNFYSASECRDLLFHVHELRFTIPQIRDFIEKHGLRFLGFLLRDPRMLSDYRRTFPHSAMTDLDSWHLYEVEHPGTFRHMYCFYCQKPE